MEIFTIIFNTFLYQPLFNILIFLYKYIPGNDFGIAIIILTILIKILLHPLSVKAIKSQKILSDIQPKIKEIQEKYKDNKEEQTKAIIEFYQKEKINPFSGCLSILVQVPILIALYRVFNRGFNSNQMIFLYNFISPPNKINHFFLKTINLSEPNTLLAILAGFLQFFQTKMTVSNIKEKKQKDKKNNFYDAFQQQSFYFFPFFTFLILLSIPSAIGLYWITITVFTIIQQYFILNKISK